MADNTLKSIIGAEDLVPSGDPPKKPLTIDDISKQVIQELGPESSPSMLSTSEDLSRYSDYIYDLDLRTNMEYRAAENQTAGDLLKNSLIHIGNEVVLGTLEASAILFNPLEWAQTIGLMEHDYGNVLSNQIRETKESIRDDYAPIFNTPETEHFSASSLINPRWWALNAGTLANTISLMGPAGAARGMGAALGKHMLKRAATSNFKSLVKASDKLGTVQMGAMGKNVTAALSSRYVESTWEAMETRDALLAQGYTEEEANRAASSTFAANMFLFAVDAYQYGRLFAGRNGLRNLISDRNQVVTKSALGEYLKVAGSEALEEATQFVISQESQAVTRGQSPGFLGRGFGNRLRDYVADDELWASAVLGALGGTIFKAIGGAFDAAGAKTAATGIQKVRNLFQTAKNVEDIPVDPKDVVNQQLNTILDEAGKLESVPQVKSKIAEDLTSLAVNHLIRGQATSFEELLEAKIQDIQEDTTLTEEEKKEESEMYQKHLDNFKSKMRIDFENFSNARRFNPKMAVAATLSRYEADVLIPMKQEFIASELQKNIENLSPENKSLLQKIGTSEIDQFNALAYSSLYSYIANSFQSEEEQDLFLKSMGVKNSMFEYVKDTLESSYLDVFDAIEEEVNTEGSYLNELFKKSGQDTDTFIGTYIPNYLAVPVFALTTLEDTTKTPADLVLLDLTKKEALEEVEMFNTPEGLERFNKKLEQEHKERKELAERYYAGVLGSEGRVEKNGVTYKAVESRDETGSRTYDIIEINEANPAIPGKIVHKGVSALDLVGQGYRLMPLDYVPTPDADPSNFTDPIIEILQKFRATHSPAQLKQLLTDLGKVFSNKTQLQGLRVAVRWLGSNIGTGKNFEDALISSNYNSIVENVKELESVRQRIEALTSDLAELPVDEVSEIQESDVVDLTNILQNALEQTKVAESLLDELEKIKDFISKNFNPSKDTTKTRKQVFDRISTVENTRSDLSKQIKELDTAIPLNHLGSILDGINSYLSNIFASSEDIALDSYEVSTVTTSGFMSFWGQIARNPEDVFTGLAGSSHPTGNTVADETKIESQKRYFRFALYNDPQQFLIRVIPLDGNEDILDPTDLANFKDAQSKIKANAQETPYISVITDTNGKPVDFYGNPIGNSVEEARKSGRLRSEGIFTMYPTSNLQTKTKYFKSHDLNKAETFVPEFQAARAGIEASLAAGKPVYFQLYGKADGVPVEAGTEGFDLHEYKNADFVGFKVDIVTADHVTFSSENLSEEEKQGIRGTVIVDAEYNSYRHVFQAIPRELDASELRVLEKLFSNLNEEWQKAGAFNENIKSILEDINLFTPIFNTNNVIRIGKSPNIKVSKAFRGTFIINNQEYSIADIVSDFSIVSRHTPRFIISLSNILDGDKRFQFPSLGPNGEIVKSRIYGSYLELLEDKNILKGVEVPRVSKSEALNNPLPVANAYLKHDYSRQMIPAGGFTSPTTPTQPTTPKTLDDYLDSYTSGPAGLDRLATSTSYQKENLKEAEKWFKERFPADIELEVVAGLIQNRAWGRFLNSGKVLISDVAARGTVYHEAFHVVTQSFLSPAERERIYTQFRKDYNGQSFQIGDKTVKISKTSDWLEVEEAMANVFSEYVMTGSMPAKAPQSFFKRLWNTIKWALGLNKSDSKRLFDKINSGYFRNKTPIFQSEVSLYKSASINQQDIKDLDDAYDYMFNRILFDSIEFSKIEDLVGERFKLSDIQKQIKLNFQQELGETYNKQLEETLKREAPEDIYNEFIKRKQAREFFLNNFDDFAKRHLLRATRYNLLDNNVNLANEEVIELGAFLPELYENEEDAALFRGLDSIVEESHIHISQKKTASRIVRLALSSIANYERIHLNDVIGDKNTLYIARENALGFRTNADMAKIFGMLANNLVNATSLEEMVNIVRDMDDSFPGNPKDLEGTVATLENGEEIRITPRELRRAFSPIKQIQNRLNLEHPERDAYSMQSLVRFGQAFGKYKQDASFQITTRDPNTRNVTSKIYDSKAYATLFQKEESIKQELLSRPDNQVSKSRDIPILLKSEPLSKLLDYKRLSTSKAFRILGFAGINITTKEHLTPAEISTVREAASKIKSDIESYSSFNLFSKSNEQLKLKLLEIATKGDNESFENSYNNLEDKKVYANVLFGYLTMVSNKFNKIKSREDFRKRLPQFFGQNGEVNTFSRGSSVISYFDKKRRPEKQLNMILDNGRAVPGSKISFEKLPPHLKVLSKINNLMAGRHSLLRTSDNKLERLINLGDFIGLQSLDDFATFSKKAKNFLESEISFLTEREFINIDGQKVKNLHRNLSGKVTSENIHNAGLFISVLNSVANPTESAQLIANINHALTSDSYDSVLSILSDPLIDTLLERYVSSKSESLTTYLIDNKIISPNSDSTAFFNREGLNDLTGNSPGSFSSTDINKLSRYVAMSRLLGVGEQMVLFFGHPSQYNGSLNIIKRLSGSVGTKKLAFVDDVLNVFIADKLRRADNKKSSTIPTEKVKIFKTPRATSRIYADIKELLGEERAQSYFGYEEPDGGGLISLPAYREFLYRTGDWSEKHEILYQWEMQKGWASGSVQIPELNPYSDIANKRYTRQDISDLNISFPTLKPQYFGPVASSVFNGTYNPTTMFKLSLTPILSSLASQFESLDVFHKDAMASGTGIFVPDTAVKFGFPVTDSNNPYELYNENGDISLKNLGTFNIFYEYFGIQQDISFKPKEKTPTGTQVISHVEGGIYDGGKVVNEEAHGLAKKLRALNSSRLQMGIADFKRRFGIEETALGYGFNNEYNRQKFVEFFVKEANRRDLDSNVIASIESMLDGINIDKTINRKKLLEVLTSIADRLTISRPRKGAPRVQVPSTYYQTTKGRKTVIVDGKNTYDSGDLDFYVIETKDGKKVLKEMEVYLPHYFKEFYNVDETLIPQDSKLRLLFGFRIPTQDMNFIESIKIKGFLPKTAGDIVIVPSEIVVKTGSDFDIDKLFLYFPHYINNKGVPEYIDYIEGNTEENRKERFKRWLRLQSKRNREELLDNYGGDAVQQLKNIKLKYAEAFREISEIEDAESIFNHLNKTLEDIQGYENAFAADGNVDQAEKAAEEYSNFQNYVSLLDEIISRGDVSRDELNKELSTLKTQILESQTSINKSIFEHFKTLSIDEQNGIEAVENKMLELASDIIKLFPTEVLQPTKTQELEDEADYINSLYGESLEAPLHYLTDIVEETKMGEKFIASKLEVGKPALAGKHHNIASETDLKHPPEVSHMVNGQLDKYFVSYRSVNRDKAGNILFGNQTNKKGQRIGYLNSQLISAFLDAGNNPFAFSLNVTGKGFGPASAMLRSGMDLRTMSLFINQPIVREFVSAWNKSVASTSGEKVFVSSVYSDILTKYRSMLDKRYWPKDYEIDKSPSNKTLEKNIKAAVSGTAPSPNYIIDQIKALNEYFNWVKVSNAITEHTLSTRLDATSMPSSIAEYSYLLASSRKLVERKKSRLINEGKVYQAGGVGKPYLDAHASVFSVLSSVSELYNNSSTNAMLYGFVIPQLLERVGFDRDSRTRLFEKMEQDLVNFIIQNKFKLYDKTELFEGKNSVPAKIAKIKGLYTLYDNSKEYMTPQEVEEYKRYEPYKELFNRFYITRENNKMFLSMSISKIQSDTTKMDRLIGMARDLHLSGDPLISELYEFQLMQSGLSTSLPNSFFRIIPSEIHTQYYEASLDYLDNMPEISNIAKNFYAHFVMNNPNEQALFDSYTVLEETDFDSEPPIDMDYEPMSVNTTKFSYSRTGNKPFELYYQRERLFFDGVFTINRKVANTFRPFRDQGFGIYKDPNRVSVSEFKFDEAIIEDDLTTPIAISGGAAGADTTFTLEARKAGYQYKSVRGKNISAVDSKELNAINANLENIDEEQYSELLDKVLSRLNGIKAEGTAREYHLRNMAIVDAAEAVFAISKGMIVINSNTPGNLIANKQNFWSDRGTTTGIWAGVELNKPVYVFDQNKQKWFTYGKSSNGSVYWVPMKEEPMLTRVFAGIGTREINEAGVAAIKGLFERGVQGQAKPIREAEVPTVVQPTSGEQLDLFKNLGDISTLPKDC